MNVLLRPFTVSDVTGKYLGWLNDPVVNRYSRRLRVPTSRRQAVEYLDGLGADEPMLAICADGEHVGNLKLAYDTFNSRVDVSIMVGEKQMWGKGIGTQAVLQATQLVFSHGINRIEAASCNPAFLRLTDKLGWQREGTLRLRVRIGGEFMDSVYVGLLRGERL